MGDNQLLRVQEYNQLMQEYKDLDHKIDRLITDHQGHTENMSPETMQAYRDLARERDELFHAMRSMEQDLFSGTMDE